VREAFLHYLDSVRLKPERIVLHSDTWWTIPQPLTEANVLNDIGTLRRRFFDRTGMFFDSYCIDLGWSDPRSFWRMHTGRFPNELRVVNDQLASLGARMGIWMSPGSGYPDGLNNEWLKSQGYEMMPFPGLGQVDLLRFGWPVSARVQGANRGLCPAIPARPCNPRFHAAAVRCRHAWSSRWHGVALCD
jgi:hypothetical protein